MIRGVRAVLFAALVAGACSGGAPPPAAKPAPKVAAPAPAPAAPVDPTEARVNAALTRIPGLKTELAALRKLAFTADVPARYQTTAEFQKFVGDEVTAALPPDKSAAIAAAMHHIGLLAHEIDLAKTLADAFVSQAAAYYDPKQKKFFVVMAPEDGLSLDVISVHELTHALQDQHFDLTPYLEDVATVDDDQTNARRFVVEGEATLTMIAYASALELAKRAPDEPVDLLGAQLPLLKLGVAMMAGMTLEQHKQQIQQQQAGAAAIDPAIQKSLEAMDQIPPVILVPLLDSYMKGAVAVLVAYEHGGWDAVAQLYSNPPQSTEQVLHPAEKLFPTRDVPHKVALPVPRGLEVIHGNTIGELEWRIYFSLWGQSAAVGERAAAGWDGDRFLVGKTADGTLVGVIATVWDSPADAKEFAKTFQAAVKAARPERTQKTWVKTKRDKVFIVIGGKDARLVDAIARDTAFSAM